MPVTQALLKDQDTTGKWELEAVGFLAAHNDSRALVVQYMPNPQWLTALDFLFPEVGASIRALSGPRAGPPGQLNRLDRDKPGHDEEGKYEAGVA